MKKQKLVYSSSIAAIISILFVVVVTILAENSPALKDWLKALSGHHWTSKSILSLGIYFGGTILLYFLPKNMGDGTVEKYLKALLITAILGTVIIFLFFTGHHLEWF